MFNSLLLGDDDNDSVEAESSIPSTPTTGMVGEDVKSPLSAEEGINPKLNGPTG